VREILGDNVVGIYLHGSAVLGGLRESSDLDVITVVQRPLTKAEKGRLGAVLAKISKNPRPLDFDLLVRSEIRPWRYPPQFDFHYSEWWPGVRDRDTNPDLAVLITMMLAGDTPLYGPPSATVIDPVPDEDFRRSTLAAVEDAMGRRLEDDTRNVVLTLARIWTSIETGEVLSKDGAATWALERLPEEHKPVLERARELYLAGSRGQWDDLRDEVRAYVDYVSNAIRSTRRHSRDAVLARDDDDRERNHKRNDGEEHGADREGDGPSPRALYDDAEDHRQHCGCERRYDVLGVERQVRIREQVERDCEGRKQEQRRKARTHCLELKRHQDRVDVFIATAVVGAAVALAHEAEVLVQPDRRLVPREDVQLELTHV
jgi:streptomycin 3"-adenylyltransferase